MEEIVLLLTFLKQRLVLSLCKSRVKAGPTLHQVVEWVALLTDGHLSQIVLQSSSRLEIKVLLEELQQLCSEHVQLCCSVQELEGCLSHFLTSGSMPQQPIPDYCIEILE